MGDKNNFDKSECPTPLTLTIALAVATIVFGLIYWSGKFILNDAPMAFLFALVLACSTLEAVIIFCRRIKN